MVKEKISVIFEYTIEYRDKAARKEAISELLDGKYNACYGTAYSFWRSRRGKLNHKKGDRNAKAKKSTRRVI